MVIVMVIMEILRLTQLEVLSSRSFSFMGDERLMMATLRGCDIFYMAGIYRVSENNGPKPQRRAPRVVLRKRSRPACSTIAWLSLGFAAVLRCQARSRTMA